MKAEFTAFNQYADELFHENFLTEEDVNRVRRSLAAKQHGFVRDMSELAQTIRTALSSGHFRLEGHVKCVFERLHRSVLPRFLGGALSHVFHSTGEIRDDASAYHAATCIQFLSSLKRIDPPAEQRRELESKVWSSLKENFADSPRVVSDVAHSLKTDLMFREIFLNARTHFRSILGGVPLDAECAFGPGKNLDRYEAPTSLDWYVQDPPQVWNYWNRFPEFMRSFVDECRRYINYSPRGTQAAGGRYPLQFRSWDMKCSAQPKSYNAFRGVGVMDAYRMTLQLALQRSFYRHGLTRNMPLTDQEEMKENLRNHYQDIGTIDLSSASDRCYWHLLYGFGKGIPFFDACYELRTKRLILPDGPIDCESPIQGEAICFPLMTTFFTSLSLAVCDYVGHGHDLVRVYGDDIQHPHYDLMIWVLEKVGAKVSVNKSYPPHSLFKESCEAHYVEGKQGMLRNARPAFIPSFKFNFRGRLSHADAYKFLILAKDAFFRDGALSKACVKLVREYLPSLPIPKVHVSSPFLGEPSLTSSCSHIVVQMRPDQSYEVSNRAVQRMALRCPDVHIDKKLSQKYQWRIMSKGLSRLSVRNDLFSLENDVLRLAAKRYGSDDIVNERDDIMRSRVLQEVPEVVICGVIADIRSYVISHMEER